MQITFLGSGTSHGVPMIGCMCAVCLSTNLKNRRYRPSILVENEGCFVLVDTTPDLRSQALTFGVSRLDAVLITHTHADHIFGLDEIRRFNHLTGRHMPVYGNADSLEDIRRIFRYVFVPTQSGGGKPKLELHVVEPRFELCGMNVRSFTVMHGDLPIKAYRFNDCAYVTDVSRIPTEAMAQLRGLDTLILDTVRPRPHATHFGLQQALDVISELRPARAFLTHLSHHYDHDTANAALPPHVRLAYDGLALKA